MNSKIYCRLLFGLLLVLASNAQGEFDHTHRVWDSVLKSCVQSAFVDYSALVKDTSHLDHYLEQLNSVSRKEVDSWSRNKQMAFWINAYNAFTLRVILDHYPIKSWTLKGLVVPRNSIIQIPGVWDKLKWKVAGEELTIGHIEHGLLRPDFKEPRIHFAIVCASIGCPELRPEAYTFDRVEAQMEEQTHTYLSNSEKGVRIDYKRKRVSVTQFFKWFNEDFAVAPPSGVKIISRNKKERIALEFISHYRQESVDRELLQSKDIDFDFLSYDWSLNDIPKLDDSAS